MAETVLEVKKLTKTFGGFKAVDGVSFEISEGEVLGLLPTTYAFEGMRSVLLQRQFPLHDLVISLVLDFIYLVLATIYLFRIFNLSKEKGFLLKLE